MADVMVTNLLGRSAHVERQPYQEQPVRDGENGEVVAVERVDSSMTLTLRYEDGTLFSYPAGWVCVESGDSDA